jgi:hypothetical protein
MDLIEGKGPANMEAEAQAEAESEAAVDGEDGEKGVSIEMELESDDPAAAEGMEDLYARMAEEFSAMPESRKAAGSKKSLFGGAPKAMQFGKKARK